MSYRKHAIALGLASCAALVAMAIVAFKTGATQEEFEHVAAPADYSMRLIAHGAGLRVLMALDVAFLVLYSAFFALFAAYLRGRGAPALLVWLGLGALLAVGVLDAIEDHHIIAMLDAARHQIAISIDAITFQAAESASKFTASDIGLVLIGLAIPRTNRLGLALAAVLVLGTLASAILTNATAPSSMAALEAGRGVGFLVGFGLAIAWLRGEPD
ncbi:MAG TPA: hypothetical protein VLX92_24105 [Kofleriaceae bacterium]|nr:hypothetical protein [Kofleriaceae bacterium]